MSNKKRYLFYLGHPAHFHLFKNVILELKGKGNDIQILIKKKDILEELLQKSDIPYLNILPEGRSNHKAGIAWGLLKRDIRLLSYCLSNRPDLMIGTSVEIGHIGSLLRIPSINVNEDDADVVPLYSKLSYPWSTHILSPKVCNNGKWEKKSVKYRSYHELAYLHPDHFTPSKIVVNKYLDSSRPYFLIRFAELTAHHDKGIRGISDNLAHQIIGSLVQEGNVHITSERPLAAEFERYRIAVNPLDMHHVMAFASLYIGDSQTMAAEAGVLGVPFVRFNDFVGRLGYLNELENHYELGYGITPNNPDRLISVVGELLKMSDSKEAFQLRRKKMLADNINTAKFMTWFIENYPESVTIMKQNPSYQYNFR
jgi:predicted glycosyltransferase